MKTVNNYDIGNIFNVISQYFNELPRRPFLKENQLNFETWRTMTRAKIMKLLGYFPDEVELKPETLKVIQCGDYVREEISFNTSKDTRVHGSFLIPNGKAPFPTIVALHDHGGFYYFGREKIVDDSSSSEALENFQKQYYGGRSWAAEMAKRGYAVLSIDAFYFGSRKLDISTVSLDALNEVTSEKLDELKADSLEYISAYNKICNDFETLVMKTILAAGTTWLGILVHDDIKSVDYLMTRKEVDKERIGCCGLSMGGFRATYLAGLDSRIKAAAVVAWMTSYEDFLNHLRDHTFMAYLPRLTSYMDLPDVLTLHAPNPTFVLQCKQDHLFTEKGMKLACDKIREVYDAINCEDKFCSRFYDNDHEFNLTMQEDAFAFFDKWLKLN